MPRDPSAEAAQEEFQFWLADMDDALERFLASVPRELATRLDFSSGSLDAYYRIPELAGFGPKPTPVCPLTLATASADRRTGGSSAACLPPTCVPRPAALDRATVLHGGSGTAQLCSASGRFFATSVQRSTERPVASSKVGVPPAYRVPFGLP